MRKPIIIIIKEQNMQQGPIIPQGQLQPPNRPPISGGELTRILLRLLVIGLIVLLIFVLIYVASSVLSGVGGMAEDFFRYINNLFRDATHAFRTGRGFGAFIQLILIAVFLGWAIRRIMNYINRR
ncbi:hypothetical protein HQ545_05865 [Candidatus Woesearchaeota archaeon]|nr:hypothetical protein [Candidatus Woesearchaeota archaeon]